MSQTPITANAQCLAESRTVLINSTSPAEFALQAGKVQNLRLAARKLNGLVIPAGEVFSFWRNIGRASRRRGFVAGRELREGCVIPNIGGGLCQLSNALYDIALRSGCEIVERHAHSRQLPGSTTKPGRDATIFWNYVDLRFRPRVECQLRVVLSRGELMAGIFSHAQAKIADPVIQVSDGGEMRIDVAETCETCGVTKCFRNTVATSLPRAGVTAWIVDKFEPEFDQWMADNHERCDWLFLPLRSTRLPAYRWSVRNFAKIEWAPLVVMRRSLRSRRLATHGAERQHALLNFDAELAGSFAKRIPTIADHVVVSQNLLPFLWRNGELGGRTFDVLMTRLPIAQLESQLDAAALRWPESRTLTDFRAPPELREAEGEALLSARYLITPHSSIAAHFTDRAIKLDWVLPVSSSRRQAGSAVVFPASTLARKGCYELRAAAKLLGLPIQIGGAVLESKDFWNGLHVYSAGEDWLSDAKCVVLPAWVEHQPRRLLQAVAAGIPVVASVHCGLRGLERVVEIECGDVASLQDAIESSLVKHCAPTA